MRRDFIAIAVLALAAAAACFSDRPGTTDPPLTGSDCTVPGGAIGADHAVVFVRNFRFLQDTVRIRPGMSVTWVNCEAANIEPHTTTSDDDVWDSGSLAPGASYTHRFEGAGSFAYFCRPHPSMRGVIIVE